MTEKKKNSTTIKKDLTDFLSIIQPVAEVVEEEAEQRFTSRKPKLDPGQSSISDFFTPIKASKSPLKSVCLPVNLQFNIGTAVKGSTKLRMAITDKAEMLAQLGVEEDTRHSEFLLPSSATVLGDELRGVMDGEARKFHSIKATDLLQPQMELRPKTWQLGTVINYYQVRNPNRNSEFGRISALNFKLSTTPKITTPDVTLVPSALPMENWQVLEVKTWEKSMVKFFQKHCFAATTIWQTGDRDFPISPEPNEFAVYLDNNMEEGDEFTEEYLRAKEFAWAMDNLSRSNENQSHANKLIWIDTMLRAASQHVPILSNTIDEVEFLDIAGLNRARLTFYRELDDYMKMAPMRAYPAEEIKSNMTIQQFIARQVNIVSNLSKLGAQPRLETQKYILIEACCMLYGYKYLPRLQTMVYDKSHDFASVAWEIQELVRTEGIDPNFTKVLTPEELEKAKKFKTDPFADIERFAVPIHEVAPKSKLKDGSNSAFHTKASGKGSKGKGKQPNNQSVSNQDSS